MQKQWQEYSVKFSKISEREQYMVLFAGLVLFGMVLFNSFLEPSLKLIKQNQSTVNQLLSTNKGNQQSIQMMQNALLKDPNVVLQQQITQYENKLGSVNSDLLKLTSELISPVQMRHALLELLKLQKGVKLVSFEVMPVEPLFVKTENVEVEKVTTNGRVNSAVESPQPLGLYRHSVKLKLQGRFFNLRNYLLKLEQLSWTFFWQEFQYQIIEYPVSELEVEIYSLSTKQAFIGV